jgi:hypothetical protein
MRTRDTQKPVSNAINSTPQISRVKTSTENTGSINLLYEFFAHVYADFIILSHEIKRSWHDCFESASIENEQTYFRVPISSL